MAPFARLIGMTAGLGLLAVGSVLVAGETFTVGDRLWVDQNENGIQDEGEPGLSGITIRLYQGSGLLFAETVSSIVGNYRFYGVPEGFYFINLELDTSWRPTIAHAGADDSLDSDLEPSGGTGTIIVDSTSDGTDWDFGVVATVPMAIGDRVWSDTNGNGVQDPGEPGLEGIELLLRRLGSQLVAETKSDPAGAYRFDDIPTGHYTIEVVSPANLHVTTADQGDDDALDSDALANGITPLFLLDDASDATDWDFGLNPTGVGDRVWHDRNGDGIQDEGEPGIGGMTLDLLDANGTIIRRTQPGNDGVYAFGGLQPGQQVRLQVTVPPGWVLTVQDAGTDDLLDSDVDPATGTSELFTVGEATDIESWDVGIVGVSIGDRVWHDLNADGVQDPDEPGLPDITLLLESNGEPETTQTDADGGYSFDGLNPFGGYLLSATPPGFIATLPDRGTPATDSDAGLDGVVPLVTMLTPDSATNVDIGFIDVATFVGGLVFRDLGADGQLDAQDLPIAGFDVELLDESGTTVASHVTGFDGRYRFAGLTPGATYRLRFTTDGLHFFSPPDVGSDLLDSDVDPATGETATFVLDFADPAAADAWSAGVVDSLIGDRVWADDGDGIDEGEPGVAGIHIELRNMSNHLIQSTITDGIGRYSLHLAERGRQYYLQIANLPSHYRLTVANAGGDDLSDSDFNPVTRRTPLFSVSAMVDAVRWDAGLVQPSIIGDRVWFDANRNGRQDNLPDEPGIEGVTVELLDAGFNLLRTTETAFDGTYSFSELPGGQTYIVRFLRPPDLLFATPDTTTEPLDSDPDPGTGEVRVVLDDFDLERTIDAGLVIPFVGGRAFVDENDNGIRDGEPGRAGMLVRLLDGDGSELATTTTDTAGEYGFTNVVENGTYRLAFELPDGFFFSDPDVGNDETDSDVDASGFTLPFVLTAFSGSITWDAGIVPLPTRIGGQVWVDEDADGIQRGVEDGIPGVRVELHDAAGTVLATEDTNAQGLYSFTELEPFQVYRLRFADATGFEFTVANAAGSDDEDDSDPDRLTGATEFFGLTEQNDASRWDAGYVPLFSIIGDRVWDDLNRDGVQDPDEPGLPGVTVLLLNPAGGEITRTTSDADGAFRFDGVVPGRSYAIGVDLTDLQRPVPANAGGDDFLDSDVDPESGASATFVLLGPEDAIRWDVGVEVGHLAIGDSTWEDIDGDGEQDPGEPALPFVFVDLHGDDGLIASTSSGADGLYRFNGLLEGSRVRLVFGAPAGFDRTAQDAAGDASDSDASDSDASDSDANPVTGSTEWFTLVEGAPDDTRWDAGYVSRLRAAGDRVWKDANGNGLQDPREPGVAGVQVLLFRSTGDVLGIRETDANGGYRFGGLFAAPHFVQVQAPAGFSFTEKDADGEGAPEELDERDSDVSVSTGRTEIFNPTDESDATRWDAGLVHACPFPDLPLTIVDVADQGDGVWRFALFDPNDPSVVTGYRVRTSTTAATEIATWTGEDFTGPDRDDTSVLAPGEVRFFQFSAINDPGGTCVAESPW